MEYALTELHELLGRAKMAGKEQAKQEIEQAILELVREGEGRLWTAPECPPNCTGDLWPWCCGGVPV